MRLTSLRARLAVAGIVLVVLAIVQLRAFVVLGETTKDMGTVVRLVALERARAQAIAKDVLILQRGEDQRARAELRDVVDRFDRTLAALLGGGTAYLPTEPVEVSAVEAGIAAPLQEVALAWPRVRSSIDTILAGSGGDPTLAETTNRVVEGMAAFADPLQQAASAAYAALGRTVDQLVLAGLLGTLVIASVVAAGWVWVGRSLVRPLEQLSSLARRIAAGDLGIELAATPRRDEVGSLTNAFAEMTTTLRRNLESLAEAARALASSSTEILAAVNQLTSGATEESAAVMEIGSTAQEVRLTAEQATERARTVAEAAGRTSQVAGEGQSALATAREGLAEVAEKVDAIAGRILALSERMQAIGEIVDVVNDLADQSNLLAVNAAIEAAKAGEQGRGFAVVAQEVRNLADQSREATGQVSAILSEIQRSANDAVLATEQGTRGVRAAVARLEEAGTVIDRLAAEIVEASELARQIAASAAQQRAGVDQIALGIENVGQVSNQTVAAARQLQQEAEAMTRLAQHLRALVERFTLGPGEVVSRTPGESRD